ncbi:antibiotic biosynthesis monooxygenase [Kamptonema cortianum]|nr:antibiotic biosynthesis monooxygenase [Kamptonema cortianum]
MYVSAVYITVKPEFVEPFITASIDNAVNSRQEAGVLRFDLLQQQDDPTRFMLYEVYRSPEDLDLHRQTAHYARWRDTVADWMAEPRSSTKYQNISPTDDDWA